MEIKESSPKNIDELETQVQELTSEIVADVFRKARESTGKERLYYIRRLKKFGSTVGPEEYTRVLRELMTNEASLDELEKRGREELLQETKGQIKKWIFGEKKDL